jgi:uncharacterized membrane protein (UPF0127 family)
MKTNRIALILAVLVFAAGCVGEKKQAYSSACFPDGSCLTLEVVETSADRARGLMHRESLPQEFGMLFEFGYDARHSIWMKNMRFPIDIIWLAKDGRVTDVLENAPPCESDPCPTYLPREKSRYVLETNAGYARAHNTREGEKITLE